MRPHCRQIAPAPVDLECGRTTFRQAGYLRGLTGFLDPAPTLCKWV